MPRNSAGWPRRRGACAEEWCSWLIDDEGKRTRRERYRRGARQVRRCRRRPPRLGCCAARVSLRLCHTCRRMRVMHRRFVLWAARLFDATGTSVISRGCPAHTNPRASDHHRRDGRERQQSSGEVEHVRRMPAPRPHVNEAAHPLFMHCGRVPADYSPPVTGINT